jgi:hypothetical protein
VEAAVALVRTRRLRQAAEAVTGVLA